MSYIFVMKNELCYSSLAGKTIQCTVVFPFDCDFKSLREATLSQWSKDFFLEDCWGKDIIKVLNNVLKQELRNHVFSINCTNQVNDVVASFLHVYIFYPKSHPRILMHIDEGINAAFIDVFNSKQNQETFMTINSEIAKFGESSCTSDNLILGNFLNEFEESFQLFDMSREHV